MTDYSQPVRWVLRKLDDLLNRFSLELILDELCRFFGWGFQLYGCRSGRVMRRPLVSGRFRTYWDATGLRHSAAKSRSPRGLRIRGVRALSEAHRPRQCSAHSSCRIATLSSDPPPKSPTDALLRRWSRVRGKQASKQAPRKRARRRRQEAPADRQT